MDSRCQHLEGAPQLSDAECRQAAGSPKDPARLTRRIYALAAEIRRRRPPGFRDPGRWGQNIPTAELQREIRDLIRRGVPAMEVGRLLQCTPRLARELAREPRSPPRCGMCGAAIDSRYDSLPGGARSMINALVSAWPEGLSNRDWAAAAGLSHAGGNWRRLRVALLRDRLVEIDGEEYYATALARAECLACIARTWRGRQAG